MPIQQTATYQVRPQAVEKVKHAVEAFVAYIRDNEPGTQMYVAWQQQSDPTHFLHFFIFKDEAAQAIHSQSEAVKRFEAVYGPELVGGNVVFTGFDGIASNQP